MTVPGPRPTGPGKIVILNGAPRSEKSTIVAAIQDAFPGMWMNLGVDAFTGCITPPRHRPGIGLRPDGKRPDIEAVVPVLYAALYDSVAALSRHGLNVAVDVGHHEAYSRPLGILPDAARRLSGLPVVFVGVRCPIEVVMARRDAGEEGREHMYATSGPKGEVPVAVARWEEEVHRAKQYDLEVDTSRLSPRECADTILKHLEESSASISGFFLTFPLGQPPHL